MSATRAITLPHGVLAEGRRDATAELRAPTGDDEWQLLQQPPGCSGPATTTTLLQRCVTRLAGQPTAAASIRALTVGDRESLMLHLRAAAFGDRLACTLECPRCLSVMDLTLSVHDLLCAPYEEVHDSHEVILGSNGERCQVRFRLPTGADQEAAAGAGDVEAGVRLLVNRCVQEVKVKGHAASAVPAAAMPGLAAAMARLDPQAETSLRARCPECDARFTTVLDASALLIGELTRSRDQLLREVHAIALRYHWSEHEILALDLRRRRHYLGLLVDEESGGGAA